MTPTDVAEQVAAGLADYVSTAANRRVAIAVVVTFGREKSAVIREARDDRHSSLPLARVVTAGPRVRWFLDDAAAGR